MNKRRRSEDSELDGSSSSQESGGRIKRQRALREEYGLGLDSSDVESQRATSETEPTSVDGEVVHPKPNKQTSIWTTEGRVKRRVLSHVALTGPAYPRSTYDGWEPPLPVASEAQAIADLKNVHGAQYAKEAAKPEYTFLHLDEFSVFRPKSKGIGGGEPPSRELVTLDRLQNKNSCDAFLVDGILSYGTERRYVRSVPFSTLTIDGYGDAEVISMRGRICIQSFNGEDEDVWYQLGMPSNEYRRFYEPFVWLAQFSKHFVDYLLETQNVALTHFRSCFYNWLLNRYTNDLDFRSWLAEAKLQNFCTTVVANFRFLWKECYGLDDEDTALCKHPIWGEVHRDHLTAIPAQRNKEKWTVVTPFAFHCFKHMYFAKHLRKRPILEANVRKQVAQRKLQLKLTALDTISDTPLPPLLPKDASTLNVQAGDVVFVEPDTEGEWRSKAAVWYVYVQAVRTRPSGRRVLDALWLYQPEDTTLGAAYYPFKNELFLSDNCSCGNDAISMDHVLGRVDVAWFVQDPAAASGLFVRQKFRTVHDENTYDFVTLGISDFRCKCLSDHSDFEECVEKYKVNDTILVLETNETPGHDCLQPAQVIGFDYDSKRLRLRRLVRKSRLDIAARPNELVLTDEVYDISPENVARKCHFRFFDADEDVRGGCVPTPYDRDGAGDFYFCTSRISSSEAPANHDDHEPRVSKTGEVDVDTGALATSSPLSSPTEGWDPRSAPSQRKLRGMGIFCGGGNFDRGLEEGGAVEFKYAIDWAERALHSYRANVHNPEDVYFWLGSVNEYMGQAIAGSFDGRIAAPGDVGVLSAGSPCPGFSVLQPDKQSHDSLMNASMVASVISFIDFYSPEYCILENVVSMTHGLGARKDENVFAQILAAFVAMGYQVQQFLMDAWSVGSSQSRSRVFIVASAPELAPWPMPPHTHAHPPDSKFLKRCLGRSSNGLPFGVRQKYPTPFPHVSAKEATEDLPDIADAQPQLCPSFPDHRTPAECSSVVRTRLAMVPVLPRGMGIVQAYRAGLLSGEPLEYVKRLNAVRAYPGSRTYSRVFPDSLFPTIITTLRLADGITGRCLHWEQHRSNTVMEVRRAQGFPDEEVIIGTPPEQVKIIGNSVDRKVSLALGLSLRETWLQSFANNERGLGAAGPDDVVGSEPEAVLRNPASPATAPLSTQSPELRGEHWVEQSRSGTLRLNDAQVEEIRAGGGFKAIRRMLCIRDGGRASSAESTASM